MGQISEVYYEELDPAITDPKQLGEYYFYYNLLGVDEIFQKGYENTEIEQMRIRNHAIKEALISGDIPRHPKLNTTILGISTLRDKAVLVTEY